MKRDPGRHYISVKWLHSHPTNPVLTLSELNGVNAECRKIEYFQDGTVGFAFKNVSLGSTQLETTPVPELEKINEDPQFGGKVIDAEEFNALWDVYV